MVYFDSWDEFVSKSVELFRNHPDTVSPPPRSSPLLPSDPPSRLFFLPDLTFRFGVCIQDPLRCQVPALRREARAQGHRQPRGTRIELTFFFWICFV
ncbi:hypothetical protein EE612_033172 [Oryza sativa]|nr:hypothetical protein EE612_033172 [Oryza sativa]